MNAVFNLHFSLQNPKRKSKKNEDLVMKDGFHCSHMIKIETNEMLRELRERERVTSAFDIPYIWKKKKLR